MNKTSSFLANTLAKLDLVNSDHSLTNPMRYRGWSKNIFDSVFKYLYIQ